MGKDLKGKELGRGFCQRKDGRYEARAIVNGVKIDVYNLSLAKLRKEFENEKTRILNEQTINTNIKVKDWYQKWFDTCKAPSLKSDLCRRIYDRKIKNTFINLLGDKVLKELTQLNIQNATNDLIEKGYNDRTIREALGVFRECLDNAVINKVISINPCQQILIKNNNECQKERRVLSQWEQELFLEEIENSYYKEAYYFLLLTGVRIGEFSGLQWNDIDWDKKVVKINKTMSTGYYNGKKVEELTTPKTSNSYREIPFFGETEHILKDWKKKQDQYKSKLGSRWRANPELGDLIFTTTMGSPVTRYVIVHDLKKIEQNLNLKEQSKAYFEGRNPRVIEHLHPHCFRHTFATRCFEKNMSPIVVQSIMGHANYDTTLSYTHLLDDRRSEEIKKVGNFLT